MYQFYRQSLIGRALVDTIDEKVEDGSLTAEQAQFILKKFDESIPVVFNRSVTSTMSFKGNVSSYNYVEGVWKFSVRDFVMSINNEYFKAEKLTIVACDGSLDDDEDKKGNKRKKKR